MAKQMLVSCAKDGCGETIIINMTPISDIWHKLRGAGWSSRIESGIEYDYCPTHKVADSTPANIGVAPSRGTLTRSPNCIGCGFPHGGLCGPCYRLNYT